MKKLIVILSVMLFCSIVIADVNDITYSAVKLPQGATLEPNGTFNWSPDYTQAGSYKIIFIATKGTLKAYSDPVVITVSDTIRVPLWKKILQFFFKEKQTIKFILTPYVVDADTNQPNVFDPNFK